MSEFALQFMCTATKLQACLSQPNSAPSVAYISAKHPAMAQTTKKTTLTQEEIDACPYDETTDDKAGIECWKCQKNKCKNFGRLLNHMKVYHGATKEHWKDNVVWQKGTIQQSQQASHTRKSRAKNKKRKLGDVDVGSNVHQPGTVANMRKLLVEAAAFLDNTPAGLSSDACAAASQCLVQCAASLQQHSALHAPVTSSPAPPPPPAMHTGQKTLNIPQLKDQQNDLLCLDVSCVHHMCVYTPDNIQNLF